MSRKLLLCTVASAALLAGPAFAADLPVKARPAPALAWSWAGFYIGGHGGYGWKRNDFADVITTVPAVRSLGGIDSDGWIAGGQVGYNWQYGRWVAGIEVDGSATQIRGTSAPLVIAGGGVTTNTASDDVKYLGTVRARVGGAIPFANTDVFLYGTGGLAWERVNRIDDLTFAAPPILTRTTTLVTPRDHFGWVAGVGGEVRLGATNWIGRVEYLHYDFGTVEPTDLVVSTVPGASLADRGGRQTIDVVRGGLSYKFDAASSPLSAYAASMRVKAAVAPLAWSWAGFYIGGHGGYGWKRNDFAEVLSVNPFIAVGNIDSTGWVAGGQAGYNWQFGRWVAGLEMDGSATEIRGISPLAVRPGQPTTTTDTRSDDVQYLGTVRARVGGAVPFAGSDALLYGTAGLAWERVNRTRSTFFAGPVSSQLTNVVTPRDHFGWVAGVGGEVRLGATNWVGRVEYLHYDFGTVEPVNASVTTVPGGNFSDRGGRQTIDIVRAGLSYKFAPASSPLSAYAASMPVKAAAPLAWSWAGYYIGGHAGYGWKQNDFTQVIQANPLVTLGGINSDGWVAGGQAGYNWQFDRWVAGFEVDGSATQIRGSYELVRNFGGGNVTTRTLSDDVKYLGTVRTRLGGTIPIAGTDVLLYGTAGLAWERLNRTDSTLTLGAFGFSQLTSGVTPRDHFGWVAGVGGEVRLGATNWIGRVEYLHYDFGTVETATTVVIDNPATLSFADRGGRQTIDVVRGGISYKFAATP